MSAGKTIKQVRFHEDVLQWIDAEIERRNANTKNAPWTFSDFVRVACCEKLAKGRRCRVGRKPNPLVLHR